MIDRLRPELEKAFRDLPCFGEVGFRVFFTDEEPARIEYSAGLSKRLVPREERGKHEL
jgi:hypothetical protein